ncbi:hypothetical protein HWV62_1250 [Athelia sp. TMB]|nr:hypothetical protein HWV62_1250 [Athelia sp. TMB]
MDRPSTPPNWAGSTAHGWGGNAPADNAWGTGGGQWGSSASAGWGDNTAAGWRSTPGESWPPADAGASSGETWPPASGSGGGGGGWGYGGQAPTVNIPPPPGATYLGNPNHVGSWGKQAAQPTATNLWAGAAGHNTPSFPTNSALFTNPATPWPSTTNSYPSGWTSAPPMQASTSFPSSETAPSWTQAMNMSFPGSTNMTSTALSPQSPGMGRSTSWNGYANSPASTLGRAYSAGGHSYDGDDNPLPDRPSEWRKDFSPRSGFGALFPSMHRPSRSVDNSVHKLHAFIRYSYSDPPIRWDLRLPPTSVSFRDVDRAVVPSDLWARFACEPPVATMRLVHARLPWYVDVVATNPSGITLYDLLGSIYNMLRIPIAQKDFWNEEMGQKERAKIGDAWRIRCGSDEGERAAGVRRVDYLRKEVMFEGLVKGRNGMWEMRTRKPVMGDGRQR